MASFSWRLLSGVNVANGHIQLITGPMFSGKTQMQEAISAVKVADVMDELLHAHVVAIDEGQFFDDIAECSENLANQGKVVIVSALDGDFSRKRFKNILDLCPLSEDIIKLNAVCTSCGEDASYTKRLTTNTDLEVIGGRDIYTAMCRHCYFESSEGWMRSISPSYGRVEVILGPIFSGKTTELLRRHNRHALASRECRVIKYKGNTRYDANKVVTHDELMHDAIIATSIAEVFNELLAYKVIAIDEGQFFSDIAECSERLANMGKIVIVAALDGDYNRRQEVIGGTETYEALCRTCYMSVYRLENSENYPTRPPLRDFNTTTVCKNGLAAMKKV